MTPIRGFFRRLRGEQDERTAPDPQPSPAAANGAPRPPGTQEQDAAPEGGGSRRRRGRRGGRGRRRNGGGNGGGEPTTEAPQAQQTQDQRQHDQRQQDQRPAASRKADAGGGARDAASNGSKGNGRGSRGGRGRSGGGTPAANDRREYRWGRRVPDEEAREIVERRVEQAQRRRRTVRRGQLDAPLPEDIAFRAAAEGGDRSILPARRRRPDTLRDTERVMVAGPRSLSGWARWETTTETEPEPEAPADLRSQEEQPATPAEPRPEEPRAAAADGEPQSTEAADEATDAPGEAHETEEPASSRPRRRGRRGGRGRTRAPDEAREDAAVAGNGASTTEDAEEIDDLDDVETRDDDHAAEPVKPEPQRPAARRDAREAPAAFVALGLSDRSLASMAESGFTEPTPIQERAIPALLNGLDVVGIAQTGSGKTVAFGVPMVERLNPDLREVQGIVLVPTRELAQQVLDVLADLGRPWGLDAVGLLGGRRLEGDFRALEAKPHVVVGTPGRIIDHLNRGTLSLRHVKYAVLDEADQMLDIGFMPDIRRILSRTPKRRQTALFSATMPTTIRRLIWQFMDDPETVSVDPELSTVESIEQIYMEVAQRDKVRGLRELIERELKGRTLVFSRTKRGVDHLERQLGNDGVRVGALHGDMDQRRRDRVVHDFRDGKLDILIATNVAARGLDIPEITHVVNYDVPQNAEEYVHRIGRTGRAGRDGKAITFVSEWDVQDFDSIREEFAGQIRQERLDLYAAGGAANR